ncbi:hypothetical protein [Micromonospora sediminicola]|uniref:hypothetical protein n=1 Tax=Micromonospora sediminicola TaxID=946078 RepID=UPI00379B7D3B
MRDEHTTSTRTRLLWLLGLATATTGAALLLAGEAHADDKPTPHLLGTVSQLADNTVRNTVDLSAATTKPARDGRPQPVRNLLDHTTRTAGTATTDVKAIVRAVTDTADHTTRPLPVVGRTIDKATDVTDTVLDHTPALTPPATVDPAPAPQPEPPQRGGDGGSDDTPRGGEGAPATPAPAREQPHSPTAGAGVPHHPNADDASASGRGSTGPAPTAAGNIRPTQAAPASPPPPVGPETFLGDPSAAASATNNQRQHHDMMQPSRPADPTHSRHTTPPRATPTTGRRPCPSPPSG